MRCGLQRESACDEEMGSSVCGGSDGDGAGRVSVEPSARDRRAARRPTRGRPARSSRSGRRPHRRSSPGRAHGWLDMRYMTGVSGVHAVHEGASAGSRRLGAQSGEEGRAGACWACTTASWRGWQGTRRLQLCTVLGACGGVWRECGAADVVRTHRHGLTQLGAVLGHLDRLLVSLTYCEPSCACNPR